LRFENAIPSEFLLPTFGKYSGLGTFAVDFRFPFFWSFPFELSEAFSIPLSGSENSSLFFSLSGVPLCEKYIYLNKKQ
jgi:hypothetical protein